MDPNATLELIVEAAVEGDTAALLEAAANLAQWIDGGGFAPGPSAAHRAALRLGFNPL